MRILVMIVALLIVPISVNAQNAYRNAVEANENYKRVTTQLIRKYDEMMEEGNFEGFLGPTIAAYYYYRPEKMKAKLAEIGKLLEEVKNLEMRWQTARTIQLEQEEKLKRYPQTYARYMNEKWVAGEKIPMQKKRTFYIDRVQYQARTINNGPRNDLTVFVGGDPMWPIVAELTATACPPGVSCPPVRMQFNASSMRGTNAVILPKVLYCTGFRRSDSIGAQVVLRDSAGNVTAPKPITTYCVVQ